MSVFWSYTKGILNGASKIEPRNEICTHFEFLFPGCVNLGNLVVSSSRQNRKHLRLKSSILKPSLTYGFEYFEYLFRLWKYFLRSPLHDKESQMVPELGQYYFREKRFRNQMLPTLWLGRKIQWCSQLVDGAFCCFDSFRDSWISRHWDVQVCMHAPTKWFEKDFVLNQILWSSTCN